MTAAPEAPAIWTIWVLNTLTGKWVRAGRTSTRAEALTLLGSEGEWKITREGDDRRTNDCAA